MPDPVLSTIHVDAPLTNMTVARIQSADNFIAGSIFPIMPCEKRSNKYFVFDRGDFNRLEMRRGAPGRKAPSVGYRVSDDSYSCEKYHVRQPTPDEIQENADEPLDLKGRVKTKWLTLQMMLQMETLFFNGFWGPSIWTTDWDGVSSGASTNEIVQWDQSGSTPLADVEALKFAVEALGAPTPNKLVVGARVHKVLMSHSDLIGRLQYSTATTNAVVRGQMAALFGVAEYHVAKAVYNSAARGQTDSYSRIATDNDILLAYANPTPESLEEESAGYIMGWKGKSGASKYGTRIRTYRNEEEEVEYAEGQMWVDMKQVSADCGAYVDAAVASDA